jgi:hypothetical protein
MYIIYKSPFQSNLHVRNYSWRLNLDFCQKPQNKIDRLTPHSRKTQTPPDPTIVANIAWFAFTASSVTDIGYYISSRFVLLNDAVSSSDNTMIRE